MTYLDLFRCGFNVDLEKLVVVDRPLHYLLVIRCTGLVATHAVVAVGNRSERFE